MKLGKFDGKLMRSNKQGDRLSSWLQQAIKAFSNDSLENTLRKGGGEKAWGEPIVGFSKGDDPLYDVLKKDIGTFYWTPTEVYKKTFPEEKDASPQELTIISWILPQTRKTKLDQRRQKKYPSERWARSKVFGEQFNNELRQFVVDILLKSGHKALAPLLSPLWAERTSENYGLASNWSERHAAFISGLGTFGLCDGLITPVGKAMRCGSVIAHISLKPIQKPYSELHEYCLFYGKRICRKCVDRCPVGAITEEGHDKAKCDSYINETASEYARRQYNLEAGSCGLCQTLVPCESKIPSDQDIM